jgi:CoA:oxalate CoA-transferase
MTLLIHQFGLQAVSEEDIIGGWLGDFPSRDAAVAERVPCAPVLTLHEAMAHPHLRQAEPSGGSGTSRSRIRHPRAAGEISRWVNRSEIAADRLGEHNEEVLRDLLSLTDKEIADLYADKVIVGDPLLDTSGGCPT